jgi:hypothetical protein
MHTRLARKCIAEKAKDALISLLVANALSILMSWDRSNREDSGAKFIYAELFRAKKPPLVGGMF